MLHNFLVCLDNTDNLINVTVELSATGEQNADGKHNIFYAVYNADDFDLILTCGNDYYPSPLHDATGSSSASDLLGLLGYTVIEQQKISEVFVRGPWGIPYKAINVFCSDGKQRTAKITGQPDTFWTIPASVQVKGKTISGFIVGRSHRLCFHAYKPGKNSYLLP